jgi:periplasmic protein TonB
MATFAHLSPDERLGLGIAAAAHVALVALLVLQVRGPPTLLPVPERMTVSLADEVSLEATAPDPSAEAQAAVAPVLSPRPAPVVERRRVLRDRVIARPTPTPTPQAGGSRIGADFLPGSGASERSDGRGAPAATLGPLERASLVQAVARQLAPKWSQPLGVDVDRLATTIEWELNEDGTLKGSPRFVSQTGGNDSNKPQQGPHREAAIRAIRLAAPFELPVQYYAGWKKLRFTFDWKLNS